MARAVLQLLIRASLVAVAALAVCALLALVTGGAFTERFRIVVWLAGALLLLLGATGGSPSMDRAIGQRTRTVLGPMMRGTDEIYEGPRVSTSAVLVLAAVALFAVGVAVGG